jgi:hypothetical protein
MGVWHHVQRRSGISEDEDAEDDAESGVAIVEDILKNIRGVCQ